MAPYIKSLRFALSSMLLVLFCLFNNSCELAVPLALTGSTMGIAYYYTNVAEKTCIFDLDRMGRGTVIALEKMGFTVSDQSTVDEGELKIKGEIKDLDVIVKLKEITQKCTKMKVNVRDTVVMDKATAVEIICQAEKAAERLAPISWPLVRKEIESIDSLPPKEAIRKGRIKQVPYKVNGKRYVPLNSKKARRNREKGIASWYGNGDLSKEGGYMTANGEVFDPNEFSAAHKYLPLPTYVRVTNLENYRSIIVRVNDRGPFSNGRIIDLSAGAAQHLGFYKKGTARVLIETVKVDD
jgi:rare lipoprotein A